MIRFGRKLSVQRQTKVKIHKSYVITLTYDIVCTMSYSEDLIQEKFPHLFAQNRVLSLTLTHRKFGKVCRKSVSDTGHPKTNLR